MNRQFKGLPPLAPADLDKRVGLNVRSDKASGLPPLRKPAVASVRGFSRSGSQASRDFSNDGYS